MEKSGKTLSLFRNALLVFGVFVAFFSTAAAGEQQDEKVSKATLKAREAVAAASADDWYTLAQSSEKCIRKKENLEEAGKWLDKSLAIKETPYNLSLKGDYYALKKESKKAMEYYVKGIAAGKTEDPEFDASDIQQKIARLVF